MRLRIGALVGLLVLGCGREPADDAGKQAASVEKAAVHTRAVEALPSPAGEGAAEPFLYATGDGVLLSWLEPVAGTGRVALRFSRHTGGKWSAARSIIEREDLFANWADFPSIVEDANGALFVHWLQKSGKGTYSYDVRMATSTDGGTTWGQSFLLNRDGKEAEHGFVTLAALPGGGVGATWLDGRKMGGGGDHEAAGHDMGGDMMVRYATVSADGSLEHDVELDGRTCECCTTGMTMTPGGAVIVYRDRSPGEIRDVWSVRQLSDGWTEPQPVHVDGWTIAGCPVNGPQVDAIGSRLATAWFTAAQDKGRALVAFSDDGGATFGKPVPFDDGKPIGRLDVVLLDEETALVTWLEQTAAGAEIRARRVSRAGTLEPSMKIADSSAARAAGFVRIARVGSDVYFAWTKQDGKSKRIEVARRRFS